MDNDISDLLKAYKCCYKRNDCSECPNIYGAYNKVQCNRELCEELNKLIISRQLKPIIGVRGQIVDLVIC